MSKNNQTSPAVRFLILGVIVGLPALFVLADKGTSYLVEVAPYAIILVMAIAAAAYSGYTSSLLYRYYEGKAPWYSWVPCFGELTMMDGKYTKIGTPLYVAAIALLVLSRMPYSVTSIFGQAFGLHFPLVMTVLAFVVLAAIQVIKGIGLVGCMKVLEDEWKEHTHAELGLIKSFAFFGFVPFVRVMAMYALNKPLSTMVQFNSVTVSDSSEVTLTEEQ